MAFAAAVLIAFTLAGCDNDKTEIPSDTGVQTGMETSTETSAKIYTTTDLIKINGFTVIRAESAGKIITDASIKLRN